MPITRIEPRAGRSRRQILSGGAAWALAATLGLPRIARSAPATPAAPGPQIQIWKGPACGCCKDWIRHLETQGFRVAAVHDSGNTEARQRLGIDLRYGSCHTAWVGGYAIEGHVPAREILRLLRERPKAIGLAVPAMPLGSPGMDGPEYPRKDPYDVLLIAPDGSARVYQSYR
ncbi:DUF411 domain-containing protein [Pelomonas sp. APW6]|uniref:DUF411 domain-containing protein n=1 Tax=Roseateles subflavus TaxID=3053353 RepID=A0ABT7LP87_9BURK|nr:DUF411 domain-containing protein [Pelomonas sp. APW6]MDL5034682.1 DUF411 domain-containing protein [Pelomonas sp. APW6]